MLPSRGACFRCDRQLRFREVRTFGGLALDWEGAGPSDLFPDAVARRIILAQRRALAAREVVQHVERLPLARAGVTGVFYLMSTGGELRGVVLEVERVEELVEERNLLRHLTDLSSDYGYVVKFTREGRLELEWTAAGLYQSTGYTLQELSDRGGWPTLIHPDDMPLLMQDVEAVVRDKTHSGEFRLVTKSGDVLWIRNRARALPGEADREELRLLGVAHDVTEQRRAEEAARRLQDELAHVTRLSTLGEMASGIAHELNQPLAAIINHADACAMALDEHSSVPPAVRLDLEQIAAQAERAAGIIRRLRGLVAKRECHQRPVDANACVSDVLALLATEARNRRIAVRLKLGEVPLVCADPVQVQQVVLNVVHNALDAVTDADEERRLVDVATEEVPAGVAITVRDHGGVAEPDIIDNMFSPFFSTKELGLGMGLTISRTIAESHGGSLEAEALAEGGLRFWFVLPVHRDD